MPNNFRIALDEVKSVLAVERGNEVWSETLNHTSNPYDLLRISARYIHFNSPFGSGGASLAGAISARQDLFQDLDEPISFLRDRSVEVAAAVFYAVIDEFGGSVQVHRVTHRSMAQATLKATAQFFGHDLGLISINPATLLAVSEVKSAYGVNRVMDEQDLFYGIGFHQGSETLADEEFRILKGSLETRWAELVDHLGSTNIIISENPVQAYQWIPLHAVVEADHARAALEAENLALTYYAGIEHKERVKKWILDGVRGFAKVQAKFMRDLTSS